mmetsp:Transcript_22673/g.43497  ORF Transcript_22673/g.43497 Transcript_22673/m.43497 type:complete len:144 (+) Transcript_22673:593-1024(+)
MSRSSCTGWRGKDTFTARSKAQECAAIGISRQCTSLAYRASCRSTSECGEASNKSLHERAPIKNFVQQFSRTSEFAKPFFLAQPRTGRCAVAPVRLYQFLVACKRQRQRRLSGSVQCSTHDPMRKPAVHSSSIRVAHGHMKLP